jgi:hypothetical protein
MLCAGGAQRQTTARIGRDERTICGVEYPFTITGRHAKSNFDPSDERQLCYRADLHHLENSIVRALSFADSSARQTAKAANIIFNLT